MVVWMCAPVHTSVVEKLQSLPRPPLVLWTDTWAQWIWRDPTWSMLTQVWSHTSCLDSQHDQRRPSWSPWSCEGHTCMGSSCHAMQPHQMVNDTKWLHHNDIIEISLLTCVAANSLPWYLLTTVNPVGTSRCSNFATGARKSLGLARPLAPELEDRIFIIVLMLKSWLDYLWGLGMADGSDCQTPPACSHVMDRTPWH